MLFLFTVILVGCSQVNTYETPVNEGPPPFTDEEISNYVEDNNIDMEALLNTSENNYAAILGENELHQIYKDDNGETASHVRKINGNADVEFGSLNVIVYAIINDAELVTKGHMLEITHDDGAMAAEMFRSEEAPYLVLYDTSKAVDESVSNVRLDIFDAQRNLLYQEFIED